MKNWSLDDRQLNTLQYFRDHANDWRNRAEADRSRRVSTIGQRNDHAIWFAQENLKDVKKTLDLGCGSGELVFELAQLGIHATGIDFSDKMVELCKEKAIRLGIEKQCQFEIGSVMDFDFGQQKFDLITAFGFIEYLRPEELSVFFAMCRKLLNPGGVVQIGSRNRLFNVFSLNQFTQAEIGAGTVQELLSEAVLLAESDTFDRYLEIALSRVTGQEVLREYPQTDVNVAGYQYAPSVICALMRDADLHAKSISPVHYHGLIPVVARQNTEMHADISNAVHAKFNQNFKLVPYSSTYIISAS